MFLKFECTQDPGDQRLPGKAPPNRATTPARFEHLANCVTAFLAIPKTGVVTRPSSNPIRLLGDLEKCQRLLCAAQAYRHLTTKSNIRAIVRIFFTSNFPVIACIGPVCIAIFNHIVPLTDRGWLWFPAHEKTCESPCRLESGAASSSDFHRGDTHYRRTPPH